MNVFKLKSVQYLLVYILLVLSASFLYLNHRNSNSVTVGVIFNLRSESEIRLFKNPSTTTSASYLHFPNQRHVTKSLSQLGKMDPVNRHTLFLNHVPKSGSEILILLLERMQGLNNYRHVRLKGSNRRRLNEIQQEKLVDEVYDHMKKYAVPLSFDRHVYFVNFSQFDKQLPTYINLVRDPADKILSRFSSIKEEEQYLHCLNSKINNCNYKDGNLYDLSIPYFCGHDIKCMKLNNLWALNEAKNNVDKYYSVVGILEELNATLEVMENKVSYFFKGVQNKYHSELLYNFKVKKKSKPAQKIYEILKESLTFEFEFYEWIKMRLFRQLQILYGDSHNSH